MVYFNSQGEDGDINATYEVACEKEGTNVIVDHLVGDHIAGQVKFTAIWGNFNSNILRSSLNPVNYYFWKLSRGINLIMEVCNFKLGMLKHL